MKTTAIKFILDLILRGYFLEFNGLPPERFLLMKFPRDPEKARALPLLGEMVDQKVLTPVTEEKNERVSPCTFFVIQKNLPGSLDYY